MNRKPDIDEEYLSMARELMANKDVNEIASALMVRDNACALFGKALKLREEPDDFVVCEFLKSIVTVQSGIA